MSDNVEQVERNPLCGFRRFMQLPMPSLASSVIMDRHARRQRHDRSAPSPHRRWPSRDSTMDARTYREETRYDGYGRAWKTRDASGGWLKQQFDARGFPTRLCESTEADTAPSCGAQFYTTVDEVDARGAVVVERRGSSKQGGTRCADSAASCSSPCPTSPLRSSRIAACIVFGVDGARYRRIAMEGGVGRIRRWPESRPPPMAYLKL